MCQIFAGQSNQIRNVLLDTKGLLADLYSHNSDGLGAMYHTTKHGLRIRKEVPRTLHDAERFIRELPDDDRNLVLHFRMKTSGNIDHANAHPFDVLPRSIAMTHNGVLSISTQSDETKCDTRHYIERVLRPQLERYPELVANDAWREVIGRDIGRGNRFVFMDKDGQMFFVNRHTGVEHEGMWIANTYSFDAGLLLPEYARASRWGGYLPATAGYDDWGSIYTDDIAFDSTYADVDRAITEYDVQTLARYIQDDARGVFDYLFSWYYFDATIATEKVAPLEAKIMDLLRDEDSIELADMVKHYHGRNQLIAEVCVYHGEWFAHELNDGAGDDVDSDDERELLEAYAG